MATLVIAMAALTMLTAGAVALAIMYHQKLLSMGLNLINAIISGVLGSPKLSEAIVDLVERILQHPRMDATIARVVSAVLKHEGARHEISQVRQPQSRTGDSLGRRLTLIR